MIYMDARNVSLYISQNPQKEEGLADLNIAQLQMANMKYIKTWNMTLKHLPFSI